VIVVEKRFIDDLMNHGIPEGKRVYKNMTREHTWLIYHDHLKIWRKKESQDYLKTLPCPIEGNLSQTQQDRQIKISGDKTTEKLQKGTVTA
jgi:hypothetical protein